MHIRHDFPGGSQFNPAHALVRETLFGFCRVRIPGKPFRPEIGPKSAGVRELHVYGKSVPLGEQDEAVLQLNRDAYEHLTCIRKMAQAVTR
jgi:elongator complex protein 3